MKSLAGAIVAGGLAGVLIVVVGFTAAAWIALAIALFVIVVGAVDYVRTHG